MHRLRRKRLQRGMETSWECSLRWLPVEEAGAAEQQPRLQQPLWAGEASFERRWVTFKPLLLQREGPRGRWLRRVRW